MLQLWMKDVHEVDIIHRDLYERKSSMPSIEEIEQQLK